nr:hypothetical protein [Hyphomonadaceae bacterium]
MAGASENAVFMQDSVTLNRVRQAQCPDHVALALEAAEKSAVLLTNSGILPLNSAELQTVAVLGRLAGLENT